MPKWGGGRPSRRHVWFSVAAVAITLGTFVIDLVTPRGVAAGVFPYFIAIFLTSWLRWPASPIVFAVAASILSLVGFELTSGGRPDIILINRSFIICVLWLVAVMAYMRIRQNAALVESQAAAETDRRFRSLIEDSKLGMHISSPRGRVFVNKALADMLGYDSVEELLNAPKYAMVAPHDTQTGVLRDRLEGSNENLPHIYEFDGRRKDGSIIRLQGVWRWIDWEGERAISRVLIDVTERKRAQDALAESEERLRLLLDTLEEGVFGVNMDAVCTFCNPAGLRLLGYPDASAVVGQDMHQLIHHTRPDGSPLNKADCEIFRHYRDGLPYEQESDIFWRADGKSFPVAYRVVPLRKDGRVVGSVTTFRDLTTSIRNREILMQRDRTVRALQAELGRATQVSAMGQVSAAMAHELHQPLTAVLNTAHAIRRWMRDGREDKSVLLDEMVPLLCEQAEKAGQVVRRIRDLFEKGETKRSLSDLNAVIEETCAVIAVEFQSTNTRITRRFASDLPKLQLDRVQIQQVVYNLLRNAMEAVTGLADREIIVTTAPTEGNAVTVSIEDSGQGLPDLPTDDLFKPFVTTKENGMGLGLYTCKTVIDAHGGKLWATAGSGGGTTFHFTLPIEQ